MKYTLLEMVQTILSSMDSDEVLSINNTVEAQQVARVVRTAYFDIIQRAQLPEHFDLKQLSQTAVSTPVLMMIPDTVAEIKWIKYNYATVDSPDVNMQLLDYLSLEDFLDRQDRLNPSATYVDSMTVGEAPNFLFTNNAPPRYYTTTDDGRVIFDSYDSAVDSLLLSSKTRAFCRLVIPFSLLDNFIPDLDEDQFPLLLNEAKSLAWAELKQSPHVKAEQVAKRGWTLLQKAKHRVDGLTDFEKLPSFGRKHNRGF